MQKYFLSLLLIIYLPQTLPAEVSPQENQTPIQLTYTQAIILGTIQGVTEFIPVSSTGHLIIANHFMGLDDIKPLVDEKDEILFFDAETESRKQPYCLKNALDDYIIIIQGGTILAVIIIYWHYILLIFKGIFNKNKGGLRLLRNLVLSFLPAAMIGLLMVDWIECNLFHPITVSYALFVGAIFMIIIERFRKLREKKHPNSKNLHEITDISALHAIFIGCMQCLALFPGMSRSMCTIVGGYITGLSLKRSAEYSFLLGLVTLTAASTYKVFKDGNLLIQSVSPLVLITGIAVAFLMGIITIKGFIYYISNHGLTLFAIYRIILGCLVFGMIYIN